MPTLVLSWIERLQRLVPRYRRARGPHFGLLRLDRRSVHILPTRAGLLFAGVTAVMLLAAMNYRLALGYALCFLLVGLGIVSLFHTWRNLVGLTLRPGRAEPVHAGEFAEVGLMVRNASALERFALELVVPGNAQPVSIDVTPNSEHLVNVALPTTRRGWLTLPQLQLQSRWPLGLWRAWAWWHPQARVLVLPWPEPPGQPLPRSGLAGNESLSGARGEDDFASIRPWRAGDSPRRLAWKAMARTGGDAPLVLEFEGGAGGLAWLDWSELPVGMDTESRISRLTRWVLEAEQSGMRYGLRLPSEQIDPDQGPAHRAHCLRALALAPV
jgi:uncharacterized protein (DUF58 family)